LAGGDGFSARDPTKELSPIIWCQTTRAPNTRIEAPTLADTHSQEHSASAPPTINVTPLIDVLLVLLIIFMVLQPQKEAKLPVRAPAPASPGITASPETLMLTVTSEFQLALNSKPLTFDEVLPKLSELMEQRPLDARTLFIKAPRLVQYGSVGLLIDLAKGAGVATVGLVADET
jgi:biopolymer transport protein ExbD